MLCNDALLNRAMIQGAAWQGQWTGGSSREMASGSHEKLTLCLRLPFASCPSGLSLCSLFSPLHSLFSNFTLLLSSPVSLSSRVQWAGSCWYYLRFTDTKNSEEIFGEEGKSWLPVDLYVGGQEHAVLHLLYARFWHKVNHLYLLCVDVPQLLPI
jgi:hypothetical protein